MGDRGGAAKDNLTSLHDHEESIRTESLALIARRADLTDHLALIHEAMNVIWAFTQEHVHNSDDELTFQFLGIRLFNAAAVSIKLALAGYYQKAFVHVRDILETYFFGGLLAEQSCESCGLENG
jgi:hypothetical protein